MSTVTRDQIEELAPGLVYHAVFVPFSRSRNKSNKELSLNWTVKLATKIGGALETDYMQGIGHLPGYKLHLGRNYTVHEQEYLKVGAETGTEPRDVGHGWVPGKPIGAPPLAEVLQCLLTDATALDYATFEQWAEDTGFEADSRRAEAIYRACLDIGLKLRRMLGDAAMDRLREALRDY